MKYSEFIEELDYWKRISGEEDPEIVINDTPYSYEVISIQPVVGVENNRAIGIIFNE
jgi:hypothetical protein